MEQKVEADRPQQGNTSDNQESTNSNVNKNAKEVEKSNTVVDVDVDGDQVESVTLSAN